MLGAQNIVCSVDKYINRLWKLESEKYVWIHLWESENRKELDNTQSCSASAYDSPSLKVQMISPLICLFPAMRNISPHPDTLHHA